MNDNKIENDEEEIAINLIGIISFIKKYYKKTIFFGLLGAFFAGLYSYTLPEMYKSEVQILPDTQNDSGSGLSALAGLAGISAPVGASGLDAARPDLYPNILQATEFGLYMLKQTVYVSKEKKSMTLREFFMIDRSLLGNLLGTKKGNLPKVNISLIDPEKKSGAIELTSEDYGLVKQVIGIVKLSFDKKGIIIVSSETPDPVVSASVVNLSISYLKKYVINYRTKKSKNQFDFLVKQVNEAKNRMQISEIRLAGFKDKNRFLEMRTAIVSEQRLTADLMLAQRLYDDLVLQLEQVKVKIQKETPVIEILEPTQIPLGRSAPNRRLLAIIGGVVTGILYIAFVLSNRFIKNLIRNN